MGELSITTATISDLSNVVKDYSVPSMQTDGATGQDETEYSFPNWTKQFGYFNSVAELKSALTMKAIWNVGKGYTTDPETQVILDHISGGGKDTFLDVLLNLEIVKRIGGDSFAEIIKDDNGDLFNLKPLDTGSMKIIVDKKGIIKRYEQINKTTNGTIKFKPEEIFHLYHNRIADQIHGISDIDAIEKMVLADGESFEDIKKIMHRQAKPMIMFKLVTDDQVKINAFIAKMDKATNLGENIYVPFDKDSIDFEVIQVDISPNTLAWRTELRNKFYRVVQLPQIIFGASGATESGGKIEYLAHEQVFERDQKGIEDQVWNQLGLRINLNPPTTLLENLQQDQAKDANQGLEIQPQDLTAGKG